MGSTVTFRGGNLINNTNADHCRAGSVWETCTVRFNNCTTENRVPPFWCICGIVDVQPFSWGD
ncbi:MAG: hypothetical protein ABIF77_03575 [bacterium]